MHTVFILFENTGQILETAHQEKSLCIAANTITAACPKAGIHAQHTDSSQVAQQFNVWR